MTLPAQADYTSTYGGELADYAPVEDPTTDRSAAQVNAALCDVSMMTRTAIRAWCIFTAAASPVIVSHDAVWGNSNAVAPTVTQDGSPGSYFIEWPTSVTDPRGSTVSLAFVAAGITSQVGGPSFCSAYANNPNGIVVETYNSAGVQSDTGINYLVFAI